jgi:hypothetical protein
VRAAARDLVAFFEGRGYVIAPYSADDFACGRRSTATHELRAIEF